MRVDGIRSVAKYSVPVYTLTAVAVVDKLLLLHRIVMVLDLIIVVHILQWFKFSNYIFDYKIALQLLSIDV